MLIDADNAQPSITEGLLAEVAKYGTAHVKRAYGDWTAPQLRGWKDQLLAQSIQPIQQFAYTRGKNATDAAMVIDAMDLLYSGRFDGFCIVSSDSDFTRLAARLRESALTVYGFGERKTPKPFVAACDKFIYIENLTFDDTDDDEDEGGGATRAPGASVRPPRRKPATAAELKNDVSLVTFLRNALEAASDDDGWAPLAGVGNIITNQRPDFDPRSYGYGKLSDLITATTLFETDRRSPGDGKQPILYARLKRRRSAAKSPARSLARTPAKQTTAAKQSTTSKQTTAAKQTAAKALRRRRGHAATRSLGGQQPLGGGGELEQGQVAVAAPGELQPHRETGGRHGNRHGRMAGQVVRAGEAALGVVVADAERRVLLGRAVADRRPGERIDAGQRRLDRRRQLGLGRPGARVLLRRDLGPERQQGARSLGVLARVPARVSLSMTLARPAPATTKRPPAIFVCPCTHSITSSPPAGASNDPR